MAALTEILFTDIETVSQYNTWNEVPDNYKKLWARQVRQSYRDHLPTGTNPDNISDAVAADFYVKKAALHAEFSKIVCMSVGRFVFENGNDNSPTLKVKSVVGDENTIISIFTAAVSRGIKACCAHNGKKFDFPFIARRSVINGLPIPQILDVRNIKPWDIANIDTQELWRFGDMAFPSLELLCTILGLEGKDDLDGSEVHNAYYKNDIKSIASHCSQDVVALARLYVKMTFGKTIDNVVVL